MVRLAHGLGINQTSVLEMAVRDYAVKHGVEDGPPPAAHQGEDHDVRRCDDGDKYP
jgi:hypothetical protein